jgi:hypothetical protein
MRLMKASKEDLAADFADDADKGKARGREDAHLQVEGCGSVSPGPLGARVRLL